MISARALAHRAPWGFSIDLVLYHKDHEGRIRVAHPLDMATLQDANESAPPPVTCGLNQTAAQELMDQLWACGLRPSEGTGSAGALAAVQAHLEDMRMLAGKALDTPLPPSIRVVVPRG